MSIDDNSADAPGAGPITLLERFDNHLLDRVFQVAVDKLASEVGVSCYWSALRCMEFAPLLMLVAVVVPFFTRIEPHLLIATMLVCWGLGVRRRYDEATRADRLFRRNPATNALPDFRIRYGSDRMRHLATGVVIAVLVLPTAFSEWSNAAYILSVAFLFASGGMLTASVYFASCLPAPPGSAFRDRIVRMIASPVASGTT